MDMIYTNPIAVHGDFADPFVLKFNGRYYLYATNYKIRCWSSNDLLNWDYEGTVIEEGVFDKWMPFAPEVVYDNGHFYMYTSPSGYGHYVLKSELPTGPFVPITDNIGHSIDGSVFIDDDEQWYFYWADDKGIQVSKMISPSCIGEDIITTDAYLNGWTEGPYIIKRHDKYYMTYTGNHYLSKGYRIHSAVSKKAMEEYKEDEDSPIIVSTSNGGTGLGHSCSVLGPDLHTYYIIYHNMNGDLSRDLNIDAIEWVEDKMVILGPTNGIVPAPKEAHKIRELTVIEGGIREEEGWIYTQSDKNSIIQAKLGEVEDYTAEINIRAVNTDSYSLIVGDESSGEYIRIELIGTEKKVVVEAISNNKVIFLQTKYLGERFNIYTLHSFRYVIEENQFILYIDNRKKIGKSIKMGNLNHIRVCSKSSIAIGYLGFAEETENNGKYRRAKPIPGKLHKGQLRTVNQTENSCEIECSIYVTQSGFYSIQMLLNKQEKDCRYEVQVDNTYCKNILCRANNNRQVTKVMESLWLVQGEHRLHVQAECKVLPISSIEFYKASSFNQAVFTPWKEEDSIPIYGYEKKIQYLLDGENFEVECEMKMAARINASIIFRGSQFAKGGEGEDEYLGKNFFIGYSVEFKEDRIQLYRHRYSQILVGEVNYDFQTNEKLAFKLKVVGNQYKIYLEGESEAILSVLDDNPIVHGCIAFMGLGETYEIRICNYNLVRERMEI